ncbi:g3628 [Coccomyxa elongata]
MWDMPEASHKDVTPSVTAKVEPLFFQRASMVMVQLVRDHLSKTFLGSLETFADVPVLGKFRVNLDDIQLDGLDLSDANTGLALGPDGAFLLTVDNLRTNVNANFAYQRMQFPQFGGNGRAQVTAVGGYSRLQIRVANDGAGRPMVTAVDAAELWFVGVRVTVSDTDLAWLYNLITNLAAGPIQDAITREVAAQVTQKVPQLANGLLAGIPRTVDVKGLELNISLAGNPLVTPEALVIRDWGRFQNPGGQSSGPTEECPYKRMTSVGDLSTSGFSNNSDPMIIGLIDQSIANCFTWVLYERGELKRYFEGDDVPGYALYTATWGLIVPHLAEAYPGNRKMGVQVSIAAPPNTSINTSRGVVTFGNLTLAFHLAPDEAQDESSWTDDYSPTATNSRGQTADEAAAEQLLAAGASDTWGTRQGRRSEGNLGAKTGAHLFTVGINGEIVASRLKLEPDVPDRPDSYRLGITMELNLDSLRTQVLGSDVGEVNQARLQLLFSLVGFLVQQEINQSVLKDGFPLPDIPHVRFVDPDLTFVQYAVKLAANVQYQP